MQRPDRVPLENHPAFGLCPSRFLPQRISGGLRLSSHCHLFAGCYSFFHRNDTLQYSTRIRLGGVFRERQCGRGLAGVMERAGQ